jgi:hypothetical protein
MYRRILYLCGIVALCTLWASAPAPAALAQAPTARWTILVYLDADNNLERDAIDDFIEMASVGSDANVNVVLQFDRTPGYDTRYGDWKGTLRFRVTQGMTPEAENALADLGEANMGHPQTLIDFVRWGMAAYPAERTTLVLWNHGDGWRTANALKRERKSICYDLTDGGDALDLVELEQALSAVTQGGARPLDLLAFDACLMAMIEIDAQVRPYVDVRVASEETEPSAGYPYDLILADLHAHPEWDARRLAQAVVERYHEEYNGETMSSVDLGGTYGAMIGAVDELAQALLTHRATEFAVVEEVRRSVQQFYGSYVDLYDLAEQLAASSTEAEVRRAAQAVRTAHEAAILHERHGAYWPGAHGISIYFPAQPANWESHYAGSANYLRLTAETQWDDFLMAYLNLIAACTADEYEPDGTPGAATPIEVGGAAQRHGFCPATDAADWVSFEGRAGTTYEIATSDLGAYCDTVLKLYDADGRTLLVEDDDGGAGSASRIEWTSPETATYYVQVQEYTGRSGQDSDYTIRVSALDAPPALSLSGRILLQGRATFAGIQVAAQPFHSPLAVTTATTTASGDVTLETTAPCTVTAQYAAYLAEQWVIAEAAPAEVTLDAVTLQGGDINGDRQVDILDIAYVGARFGGTDARADINGDGEVDILDLAMAGANFGKATSVRYVGS